MKFNFCSFGSQKPANLFLFANQPTPCSGESRPSGKCGALSSRPWDKRGEGGVVSKKFVSCLFRPFGPQFGLKIRGAGPTGPLPCICHCLIQLKQASLNSRTVGVFLCRLSLPYSFLLSQSQREEAKKFAEIKRKLRLEIQELRETVLQMMRENQEAPELERLDRHEYNLDVDQRQKLVLEGEEKIKQVWASNFVFKDRKILVICYHCLYL